MLSKVNHTQIANQFIDEYMGKLSGNACKVFLAIARKTIGWHKDYERISNSKIMSLTGIKDVKTLNKAIKELIDAELIIQERTGTGRDIVTYYEICYSNHNENDGKIPPIEEKKGGKIPPINGKKGGEIPPINQQEGWKNSTHKRNIYINKINKENRDANASDVDNYKKQFLELADYLSNKIQNVNKLKKYKNNPPDLSRWAEDIEKLHRIDGIDVADIKAMIDWVYTHYFWSTVILSARNLREKYARLEAAKNAPNKKATRHYDEEITPVVKAPKGFVSW